MAIQIDGKQKRIGLALSGGGFRAAAFHLGVFRHLEKRGILWDVDLLSCVSGGSIAGAYLALHWRQPGALDGLERYLRTRSIAVACVLGGIIDPFHSRLEKLADSYDDDLFAKKPLDALAGGPRLYLNATDMATGNLFFFAAGGGGPSEMGDHELGVAPAGAFPIARAVAASSAFPPVFPPLRLDRAQYPSAATEYLTLSDGGIYDNLGVNPLLLKRNELDYAVVSDGGKPFAIDTRPAEAGSVVVMESIGILMEQCRGLQFRRLELSGKLGGPKPLWFSIDSQRGAERPEDATFASAIGTNLARLAEAEMSVLTRHGAALVAARFAEYAPEIP